MVSPVGCEKVKNVWTQKKQSDLILLKVMKVLIMWKF